MPDPAMERRMVVLAAIAQNVTTGLLFGTFGTMLFALEARFGADRGQSSLTMSLSVVTLSLVAAWLGTRIGRQRLKPLMIAGSLLSIAGYAVLTVAQNVWQLWAVYLFLLGPGAGLCGVLATNSLAAAWTPEARRGRALGWVNAPIMVTIAPLAAAAIMKGASLNALFLVLATGHVLLLPLLMLVREPELERGQAPSGEPRQRVQFTALLFALVLIVGVISGGGLLKVSHLIPLVTAQGHSFDAANLLLSISGITGIAGSILFGWLSDRIGPSRALALNAAIQALSWLILLVPSAYWLLVIDAVAVGVCGGGLQATIGALLGRLYGKDAFAAIYGLLSIMTLPFLFGMPWLAGVLFVSSGGYSLPIMLQIVGFALAGLGAWQLIRREHPPLQPELG